MYSDSNHPFFKPLWRRVLIVGSCLVWSGFEWWNGEQLWGAITLAIAAYGIFALFINYRAPPESE